MELFLANNLEVHACIAMYSSVMSLCSCDLLMFNLQSVWFLDGRTSACYLWYVTSHHLCKETHNNLNTTIITVLLLLFVYSSWKSVITTLFSHT